MTVRMMTKKIEGSFPEDLSTDSSTESSTVSLGVFEQVKWERDIAIKQLKELGYGFGEKIRTDEDCIRREDALMTLTGEWTEPTDELIYRFIKRIKNLPPVKPKFTDEEIQTMQDLEQAEIQKAYEIGKGERQIGHCKDCKFFEYDSVAKVDGIPLIVAHEICSRWGDGCKTKEDGYCFLYDPQESEE